MTFALTSPVTGALMAGFTAPTYTHVADTAPDVNAKQWAVTALGGTQAGVTVHSVAAPFTNSFWRPKVYQSLGKPNPVTGLISQVPMNSYKMITRKGVLPLAGQPYKNMNVITTIDVPAGADVADPANVKGCLSFHFGAAAQQASGIGDVSLSGII